MAAHCTELASLTVTGCRKLTDEAVKAVAEHCPGLTSLFVSGGRHLTDAEVKAEAEHCPVLTSLSVSGRGKLTDEAVKAVAAHCLGAAGRLDHLLRRHPRLREENAVAALGSASGC